MTTSGTSVKDSGSISEKRRVNKRIYLSPPHMGDHERALLLDAFDSNWIAPLGPHVDAFERELAAVANVQHGVALATGTAALHLALQVLGVARGDEVLLSTLTFSATANAVMYVGATPVFIDSDKATWNIDPALLEEEIENRKRHGKLPRAVISVDLYGQCADYDRITAICQRYDIPLIEDAAEALGATYRGRPAGSFGSVSVFSFNGNKIITTSGGGALLSNDKRAADQARFLSTQAREPFLHYEHREVGYNYRMSNLLAAVGRGQLRVLDDRIAARRANFAFYRDAFRGLPGLDFMPEAEYGTSTRWLSCLTVDPRQAGCTRSEIINALDRENIEARPVWKPMHLQPVFRGYPHRGGPVSERIFEEGICLPSGSSLEPADLERIAEIVRNRISAR